MSDIHLVQSAIKTTVEWINTKSCRSLPFDDKHLLLLPGPAPNDRDYFRRLAILAADRANKEGYSSLLAGAGNETDETGDVGFYLGEGEYDKPEKVLEILGLQGKIHMCKNLSVLKDEYSFRVEGEDSKQLFFVVGKTEEGGWGGLVGAGVWT
ncbi:hypothetical protein D9613_000593 [Agrocybe pediades]|uniref:Uncharacterized protein n=1 Tax=Agrocybe pediades TaxID=84607 RepID=A0A8H4VSN0_9AGAR|nr:hypothetical protein D9613_000593 [Agrocybe pediades]